MTPPIALADFLTAPAPPFPLPQQVFCALSVGAAEFSGVRSAVPQGFRVAELRGTHLRTVAQVFDEYAPALQFPYYFGGNKDAFTDCLRDLDYSLGPASGYVLAIRDADHLLVEAARERSWFIDAMVTAAADWQEQAVRFRVVLQGAPFWLPAQAVVLAADRDG